MRMFIVLLVLMMSVPCHALTVSQPNSSSSSSLTNSQVQATNVANNSIGPVQTTAQIMYVTNSATYSTTVPPATGIWYNIGSVGAGTVGTRTYSVNYYDGSGSPAWVRFSVYRTNPSGGAMGIGDVVSYSVSSNGFGAVGVDGAQQVFVQITNSSHNTLSPSVFITGFSPDTPDANFTLAFTTSSIASVGYKHYMTPSTNRSIVRATMGDFDVAHVGTLNVDSNTIYLGSTRLSDSGGTFAVSGNMQVGGDQTVIGSGFMGIGMTNPASALTVDGDIWTTNGWIMAHRGAKNRTNELTWTNGLALNGVAVGNSGSGGVYAFQGTNNIAPTGGLHTVSVSAKDSVISGGRGHELKDSSLQTIISGGYSNKASGWANTVAGGYFNNNDALFGAFIGGGYLCGISNGVYYSATVGGVYSYILSDNSFVGPGESCYILGTSPYSFVGGGRNNHVNASSTKSVVCGGSGNVGGALSFVGGGQNNTTAGGSESTVAGGSANEASAQYASVLGGRNNKARAMWSSIVGGDLSTIEVGAWFSSVLAGGNHSVSNGAKAATVLGGYDCNVSTGAEMTLTFGERANAKHSGVFVWADNRHGEPNGLTDMWETVSSVQSNEWIVRVKNGVHLTPDGNGTTNRWTVAGIKIVTNANVFIYWPGWQGSQLLDVGSNRIYYAVGLTTNDWKGTNLN